MSSTGFKSLIEYDSSSSARVDPIDVSMELLRRTWNSLPDGRRGPDRTESQALQTSAEDLIF